MDETDVADGTVVSAIEAFEVILQMLKKSIAIVDLEVQMTNSTWY
jgi:hypothetical protein